MKTEFYINKIIEKTGLHKNEIEELVKKKKDELKGLISEEGALFIIAKDLGVDVREGNKEILNEIDINISDITSKMKNITLIGRIKDIYNINTFQRNDGSTGHVGSFLLHDNTGDIRIVLWDEQTNIINNKGFAKNELVKIINGYAKQGRDNKPEVQIGRLGKLILTPEDVDYKKFPKVKEEKIQIQDINLTQKSIILEGKIIQKFSKRQFKKSNGEVGLVESLILADNTGTVRITFWNEDTNKIEDCNIGDLVSITSLNPRLNNLDKKSLDLYASRNTIINKIKKELILKTEIIKNIKSLQNKQNTIVSFKGIITSIDNLKNITLKTDEVVSLLGFVVSDETDYIRVTLWRKKAEEYSKVLKKGTGILLKNVMTKYNTFSNRYEINVINDSSLELIDLKIDNIKNDGIEGVKTGTTLSGNYTYIDSINSSGFYEIKGFIAKDLKNITIYEACSSCFKKIDNCTCEKKNGTIHRMIINLIIDDESSTIRTTFIGEIAEKLIGVKTKNLLEIIDTPDLNKFIEKKSSELLGKDIIVRGKAKFSEFNSSYELIANNFQEVNVSEELNKTIKELGI